MPLDIPAVSVTSQTIRYAKAAWDFNRDGGDVGEHKLPSQQVPPESLIIGWAFNVVTPLASSGSPTAYPMVGTLELTRLAMDTGNTSGSQLAGLSTDPTPDSSWPISLYIDGDPLTAGSMLIYVFYV